MWFKFITIIQNYGDYWRILFEPMFKHYDDVTMGAIASQITSLTIVYSTVYSDADQRKHQSSASLTFVRGIHRGPVNSPHKWPVTRKMFPFAGCPAHRSTRKIGKKDFFTIKNRRKIGKYYQRKGGKQEHNSLIWNSKLLSYDGLPSPRQLSQSPLFYLKRCLPSPRQLSQSPLFYLKR